MTKKKVPQRGEKEIIDMRFKPAENGLVSEVSHRTARGGQGGGPQWDMKTEDHIHPSMAHAVKHLKDTFGHVFGEAEKKGENEPDGGGTGKADKEGAELKGHTEEPGEEDEVGD